MLTYLGVWSLGLFSPTFFSTSSKKKKKKKSSDIWPGFNKRLSQSNLAVSAFVCHTVKSKFYRLSLDIGLGMSSRIFVELLGAQKMAY